MCKVVFLVTCPACDNHNHMVSYVVCECDLELTQTERCTEGFRVRIYWTFGVDTEKDYY